MSRTAFSIQAFGVYLLALGVGLILVPNLLLGLFRLPPTSDVWIRVVGVVVLGEGIYYWAAARSEATGFFRATLIARPLVLVAFGAFAALGLASPVLVLFGLADAAGALWTWLALRSESGGEGRSQSPVSRIDPRFESRM